MSSRISHDGNHHDLDEGSVTNVIKAMRTGDGSGAELLYSRFAYRLKMLVKARLHPRHRQMSDEEDVVLVSLMELFRGLLDGQFTELGNRNDFWRLLVRVAHRNVIDQVHRERRQKRGGGRVNNEASLSGGDRNSAHTSLLEQVEEKRPGPDLQLMITERVTALLESLNDYELRRIALEKAAGATNQEVADSLGISLRSVERRLAEIRRLWTSEEPA